MESDGIATEPVDMFAPTTFSRTVWWRYVWRRTRYHWLHFKKSHIPEPVRHVCSTLLFIFSLNNLSNMLLTRWRGWRAFLLVAIGINMCVVLILLRQTSYRQATHLRYLDIYRQYLVLYKDGRDSRSGRNHAEDTCRIPQLDPWDPSIMPFIFNSKPLVCKSRQLQHITYVDSSHRLHLNETALKILGYGDGDLDCEYQEFDRKTGTDDETLNYLPARTLSLGRPSLLNHTDFVTVTCKNFININKYSMVHTHAVPRHTAAPPPAASTNSKPNVIMLGIDSMSTSNFMRKLPLTYQYLTNNLHATVLRGYNKVADNTFPNLVPIFTGQHAYGNSTLPKHDMNIHFFDHWPFIWKDFTKQGYATMYAEDFPAFDTFNYLAKGFLQKPVDHYMRPFWLHLSHSPLNYLSSHLCYDTVPVFQIMLNYLKQVIHTYHQLHVPLFAFSFQSSASHEYINQVGVSDKAFLNFLQDLHDGDYLENTVLFMFSDHGHRFDSIRSTLVGRIEERMPFMSFVLPQWIYDKYPAINSTLRSNINRLTTPFDIYEMLQAILNVPNSFRTSSPDSKSNTNKFNHGLNLFSQEVGLNRSCTVAAIPEEFCICQKDVSINVSDVRAVEASETLVKYINTQLNSYHGLCLPLRLEKVLSAQVLLPEKHLVTDREGTGWKTSDFFIHFILMIKVRPSDALLEGMVKYNVKLNSFTVIGDVNRINKYGNQSKCISDRILRKYCYCHNYLPSRQ